MQSPCPFLLWEDNTFDNEEELEDETYQIFVDSVLARRPQLTRETLVDQVGAKIILAAEAATVGLADKDGQSRETTLRDLSAAAGVADDYNVITFQ